MSDLLKRQHEFSKMIPDLLDKCFALGYDVTILEVKRTQKQADENAAEHIGIKNSLHLVSLAIDIALFKNDQYLTDFNDYAPIGIFWECIGGSWGGRFTNVDLDHFSLPYKGVR